MADFTDKEKFDAFLRHWNSSGFGPVWNDDGEEAVYRRFIVRSDPEVVRDAIWKLVANGVKRPKLGGLVVIYKSMMIKKNRNAQYEAEHAERVEAECETCDKRGWTWVLVGNDTEVYPCHCEHGAEKCREKFGEDMNILKIATLLKTAYDIGCFRTKEQAEAFRDARAKREEL